ncbi:MAG: ParB/RepB/Spo0J family partition protein [Pseudomonadales bacterium]|nr:ParB/RepB/Spo0J family partition protein [Pseudomonadales bacterium]
MASKKRGLGKNLNALLGANAKSKSSEMTEQILADTSELQLDKAQTEALSSHISEHEQLREMPIELMQRGKYQPRRDMSQQALEELSASIQQQGLMQPIVVRPVAEKKYEIIAGERRWRASQLAGLDKVPVLIKHVPDEAAIVMSLIENIQREDLNPIEEAMALHRLQQEFALTQAQVAEQVGKSRSTVANLLRLINLRDDVRILLEHGDLEMGHAKTLLALEGPSQSKAAQQVVSKSLSVRQTEVLVRKLLDQSGPADKSSGSGDNADIRTLENELSQKIGSIVKLQHTAKGKGKLVINYSSLDELDGVLMQLRK